MVNDGADLSDQGNAHGEYLELLEACVRLSTDAEAESWLPRVIGLLLDEKRMPQEQLADWLKDEV